MFAALIGVDRYDLHHNPLRGAKNDVHALADYFRTSISPCYLRLLLNEDATKVGSMQSLQDFCLDNNNITIGDTMLSTLLGTVPKSLKLARIRGFQSFVPTASTAAIQEPLVYRSSISEDGSVRWQRNAGTT